MTKHYGHHNHYKYLHVPDHWEHYWSKYPNGYTLLEALISWTSQVNDMIASYNHMSDDMVALNRNFKALDKELRASWAGYKDSTEKTYSDFKDEILTIINNFIGTIDPTIQDTVVDALTGWLTDGTLADIINSDVFDMKEDKATALATKQELLEKMNFRSFPKYGKIDFSTYPGLQHNINFDVWRDPETGLMKNNYKLDESGYVNRYIATAGSSSNDGKTAETAWGNFKDAIRKIEGDPSITKAKINFVGLIERTNVTLDLSTNLTKDYIITSDSPIGSRQVVNDFSKYQDNVYRGSLPYAVSGVIRLDEKESPDKYLELKKVDSLSECLTNYNSFYASGTEIYINKENTTDENTFVAVSSGLFQFTLAGGYTQKVVLKNMHLINGTASQPCYFTTDALTKGNVELYNVTLQNFGGGSSANGISTNGILDTKLFNCKVFNVVRDGFNYHNTREENGRGTVFEFNCYAENTGLDTSTSNNNISTAHEAIHIVRVNTKGANSRGPLIADVNGCHSLNIDVVVNDTGITGTHDQISAFYFDDSPSGIYAPNPNGKAWLINCAGGSSSEWGISGDDAFSEPNKIYIDNFRGANINPKLQLEIM